jgi:predicted permease
MNTLSQDFRYGVRMLLNSPGFTAACVICLALGIGATTAIFSIVHAVLLRPLPYAHPERLVRIYSEFPTFPNGGLKKFWTSPPEFLDLRHDTKSWESIDAWVNGGANLSGGKEPARITASYVSGSMLSSLGVAPTLGRLISIQDDDRSAPLRAVISHGLWQRAFGGDRAIVGRDVLLDGQKCTIVGVMPSDFRFPPGEVDAPELWAPLQIDPVNPGSRSSHYLSLLGRLKPGVGFAQARAEMTQLVNEWGKTASPNHHVFSPKFHPVAMFSFHDEVVGNVRLAMLMLLGAVAFVLLIACVNVANLLLARAEARQREIAIRTALGAGAGRLVRQFMTEGVVLSLAGAVLGLALAFASLRMIATANAASLPRASEIAINGTVLLFTLGLSFLTGVAFGLAPMAQVLAQNVHDTLKAAASRTTATVGANRFRSALVVCELALALMLLIGSGLMVRAFWKLQEVNTGFDPRGLITMRLALPNAIYPDNDRITQFWTSLEQRVSAIPGVTSATIMTGLPPLRPINANDTKIEGFVRQPDGPMENVDYWQLTGDRYFETMGIRLIEGRFFDARDGAAAPRTVIVNQTMARVFWPGQSAVGHRVQPGSAGDWRTVVGVVADVKNAGIDKPTGTELYIPYRQLAQGRRGLYVVLKTSGNPEALVSAARAEIRAMDSSLPIANIRTIDEVLSRAQARPRFLTLLLAAFSIVALTLAAVGIYGVIAYSVAQRTGEFGVRIAMGATSGNVLGMVLGHGLAMGGLGVALGAVGAFALTRLIRGLLFGVSSFDPLTFIAMAALLTVVTLLACYLPARRATRVDPMIALRYE